ncbi:hypothetical protein ACSYAD_01800 [Acaryochloris marina NIES-2412]|uniref:hypothetical protein n=1 Tax=Acaryochloris marina TaxID=155978 RepID=UPI004057D27C
MPDPKALEDFVASRNILAANIELFHNGHRDVYRVIAVELRKLLCDGKNSLAPRMFPNPKMHPLRGRLPPELKKSLVFSMTSQVKFDGQGGSRIIEMFDRRAQMIPLEEWLNQDLFNKEITIKNLIRSVADKEAAHSDKTYNNTLNLSRSIKLVDEDIHKQHIVAIGEYQLEIMNNTISRYPDVFGKHEA